MIDSGVIAVQRVLPGALIELVRRQPTSPAKVDFAWRTSVGPAIARASSAVLGDGGTLTVTVADARWRREISHNLPLVRARLERLLGDAVTAIVVAEP
jgi:hypothetical protein